MDSKFIILALIWANMLNSMQLVHKVVGFKQIIKTPLFAKIGNMPSHRSIQYNRKVHEAQEKKEQNQFKEFNERIDSNIKKINPWIIKELFDVAYLKKNFTNYQIQEILVDTNKKLNSKLIELPFPAETPTWLTSDVTTEVDASRANVILKYHELISKQCDLIAALKQESELHKDIAREQIAIEEINEISMLRKVDAFRRITDDVLNPVNF